MNPHSTSTVDSLNDFFKTQAENPAEVSPGQLSENTFGNIVGKQPVNIQQGQAYQGDVTHAQSASNGYCEQISKKMQGKENWKEQ